METVFQDITAPASFVLHSHAVLEDIEIICSGSLTGRFLFRTWSPMIVVKPGAQRVTIRNVSLRGGNTAIDVQ